MIHFILPPTYLAPIFFPDLERRRPEASQPSNSPTETVESADIMEDRGSGGLGLLLLPLHSGRKRDPLGGGGGPGCFLELC